MLNSKASAVFINIILIIILLCSCSKPTVFINSDSKSLTEKDNTILNIATSVSYEPFEYKGSAGELLGFDMALAMCIAEKMDRTPIFYVINNTSLLNSLNCGIADISLFHFEVTDDKRQIADFSYSYITIASAIVTNSDYIAVNSTNNLREAQNIAVIYNSHSYDYLKNVLGLDNIAEYRNYDECEDAILCGDADVMFTDTGYAEKFVTKYPEFVIRETNIDLKKFSIAVAKGNSELTKAINSILEEFKNDNTLLNLRQAYINSSNDLRSEYDARLKEIQFK